MDTIRYILVNPLIEVLMYTAFGSVLTILKTLQKQKIPRPQEANAEFAAWKLWVGVNCTWLYIGSQDAWAVFIIYLFFRSSVPFILIRAFQCYLYEMCSNYQILSCPASMAVFDWGLRAALLSTTMHLGIFSLGQI